MKPVSRRRFLSTATGLGAGASLAGISSGEKLEAAAAGLSIVTLAGADYVRFLPLAAGDVRGHEIQLNWLRGERSEMLRRATSDPGVDGGEASMAQHVVRLDRGDRSLVAIPVFPLRNFTARDLYTRKGLSLEPAGLSGRRVGIYNWVASGAVWYRHLLRYFGADPAKIQWVVGSPDSPAPVAVTGTLPGHVSLAPSGKSLSDLLLAGELDAFFGPLPPSRHHPADGPIVRLIPDFRATEQRYFKDTRCYPPQHVILIRRPVWEKDPSMGAKLVETFNRCEAAFVVSQHHFPYNSPWLLADVEETELLMGRDYHAHGLEKNRHAVDVFCRSAFADGLTARRVTVEEFFAEFLKS